jgi:hypothetical protein
MMTKILALLRRFFDPRPVSEFADRIIAALSLTPVQNLTPVQKPRRKRMRKPNTPRD